MLAWSLWYCASSICFPVFFEIESSMSNDVNFPWVWCFIFFAYRSWTLSSSHSDWVKNLFRLLWSFYSFDELFMFLIDFLFNAISPLMYFVTWLNCGFVKHFFKKFKFLLISFSLGKNCFMNITSEFLKLMWYSIYKWIYKSLVIYYICYIG